MSTSFGTGPINRPPPTHPENPQTSRRVENSEIIPKPGKTQSYASRFFAYFTGGLSWGAAKLAEAVAISPGSISELNNRSLAYLEAYTGDKRFGEFIEDLSPVLSELITDKLLDQGVIKSILQSDKPFVARLTRSLINEASANIASQLAHEGKPVTLVTIFLALTNTINDAIKDLIDLEKLMKDPADPEIMQKAKDSSLKILSVIFPYGGTRLPLNYGINTIVWNKLKNSVIPDALIAYAKTVKPLLTLSQMQNLEHLPHASLAKRWVGSAVAFAEEQGRSMLKKEENAALIVQKLMNIIPNEFRAQLEPHAPLIMETITQFGNNNAESVKDLWTFANSSIEAITSYIFFHFSRTLDPNDKGIGTFLQNLLKLIDTDFTSQHQSIISKYQQIRDNGGVPENEPDYLKLFQPYVEIILNISGLKGVIAALPKEVRGDVRNEISQRLLISISQNYHSDFPELLIGYASMAEQYEGMSKDQTFPEVSPDVLSLKLIQQGNASLIKTGKNILADEKMRTLISKRIAALPENLSPEAKDMLSATVESFLSGENPVDAKALESLWNLLSKTTESLASYIVYNAGQLLDPERKGGGEPFRRFIELIKETFLTQHPAIQETYARLVDEHEIPEISDEYISKFYPLIALLEKISGVTSIVQKFPLKHRVILESFIHKFAGAFIAKHYDKELAPLLNYMVTVNTDNLELESNDKGIRDLNPIADKLAQFISKQKPELAEKISNKLVGQLPELEHLLDRILRGAVSGDKRVNDAQDPPKTFDSKEYDDFSRWMERWVLSQINTLEDTNDPMIQSLWQTVNLIIDDLLSFLLIGKGAPTTKLPLNIKLSDYADLFIKFMELSGTKLKVEYCKIIEAGNVPEETPDFVALFIPLCQKLTNKLMLEDKNSPLPNFIKQLAADYLNSELPLLLAKQYRQFIAPVAAMQVNQNELISMLGYGAGEVPESVNQLNHLLKMITDKIIGSIEASAFEIVEKHTGFNLALFRLPKIQQLRDSYVNQMVHAFLMQLIVNYIKNVDANGHALREVPLSDVLKNLARVFQKHLTDKPASFFEAASLPDPNERKQALRIAFSPMAKDLIDLFRSKEASVINAPPVTLPFEQNLIALWNEIEQGILPDVLASLFLDITPLTSKKVQLANELEAVSGTTHIPEACRVLGHWVADFLPPFLFRERELIVETLFSTISKVISTTGSPTNDEVSAYLEKHGEEFKRRICEDLFGFFPPDGEIARIGAPITKEYVETILLKVFKEVALKVRQKEDAPENQGDYILSLGIQIMTIVHNHFSRLNSIAANKKLPPHKVTYQEYVEAAGDELHRGIPRSKEGIEADLTVQHCRRLLDAYRTRLESTTNRLHRKLIEKEIRKIKEKLMSAKKVADSQRLPYFTEFSKNLMDIAGLRGPDDLPFPSPLKEQLWNLVEQDLLPMVFQELLSTILEPKNLNSMVIAGLEILNEALDKVPDPNEKPYVPPKDEKQKELNRACGALILSLVNIIPRSILKTAFKIDRLKVMTAESVGATVREVLRENWSLMTVINTAIESGLNNLHPGEWKELDGKMKFVPAGESGELKFSSPINAEEVEFGQREALRIQKKSRKEMKQLMLKTTQKLVKTNIRGFLNLSFKRLNSIWTKCIDKVFGKHSTKVKNFFHSLGNTLIFRAIKVLASIVSYPFDKAFWFFVDIYIGIKAEHVIKNLELNIHESLLYKIADALTDALKTEGEIHFDKEQIKEFLDKAESIEKQDLELVGQYLARFNRFQATDSEHEIETETDNDIVSSQEV